MYLRTKLRCSHGISHESRVYMCVLISLIHFSEAKHYFVVFLLEVALMFFWLNNTPGGCNGVSKLHYKGKQGEYYVMV